MDSSVLVLNSVGCSVSGRAFASNRESTSPPILICIYNGSLLKTEVRKISSHTLVGTLTDES